MIEGVTLLVFLLPLLRFAFETLMPVLAHDDLSLVGLDEAWETSSFTIPLNILWLGGVVVNGFILAQRWRSVRQLRITAEMPNKECVDKISTCLAHPETVTRQSFRVSPQIKTPLVLPGLRSIILLPKEWDSWPLRLQSGALRHEWHHLRNRDALWNVWMAFFRAVFWFHPLAWMSVKLWTDACEDEADLAAVGSCDPADYAQDLLSIAKLRPLAPPLAALGFLGSSRAGLQRRIRALLASSPRTSPSSQKPFVRKLVGPVLICASTFICMWMGARQRHEHTQIQTAEAVVRLTANAFPADE